MPIKKAALKRMRADKKRHQRNISVLSDLKTRDKKLEKLFSLKDKEKAAPVLKELIRKLDKAVEKGIIKKNKGDRKKSRLMKKFNAL